MQVNIILLPSARSLLNETRRFIMKTIETLTRNWHSLTWKVIEFQKLDIPELQKLFDETYKNIECYSTESLVPKEFSGLLLEMHDFSWWVSDLDDTPMHTYYQEIVSLVSLLNKYFLTRDANTKEIERLINQLSNH